MVQISREAAQSMLESVRREQPKGYRVGLSPAESEDVLLAYLELLTKFDRITTCR